MSKLKLAILVTLLLPASAWAQSGSGSGSASSSTPTVGGKYKRQQDVKVDVKLSDRVKPIQQKPQGASEFKPELTADSILNVEVAVGDIRAEQEQILVDLIQQTPDSEVEEKSDYYFRLGELYAKQQRTWRLKSAEAQIAVDKAKTQQQKTQLGALAKKAQDQAKAYMVKAVKVYRDLTGNDAFRNYPKMDMALFYYGYTLQGGHYMKEARDVYDKLLKNYPSSKYVPEAHLAFADYFFEQNQLDDAEARYLQVLKFPKSSAYWYAKYKMGWIHLNKQRFEQALQAFFEVAQATKNDKKQDVLNRASKKDFVRAYAEIGKADQAFNAFKRVDANFAFDMLQILADLYLEQGKSDKAIFTYRDLMKRAPTNKNVCLWQYNVAHAMLSMPGAGNGDKVGEIEKLNHVWGALKGTQVLPDAEKQECHDNAAAMSGELARAYHSESAKTKNPETLGYAEKLYKVYLEVFPDAEDFAQTQYYYAELLWSRAENEKQPRLATELWMNAANAFTDVVHTGKVDQKLMKESAYAAVLGWKNALNVDPRAMTKDAEKEDEDCYKKKCDPEPIPDTQQKMLAAFDIYINYIKNPKDDELVGMKFLKANMLRRYHHFDEALPIFLDILDHHSEHETAEFSANLLLDIYNQQQKYDDLLALAEKLSANKAFIDGKDDLKERLATIKAKAMRDKVQNIEKVANETKDYAKFVECGEAYLGIYNTNPEDPKNDEVLYNAGVCYREGKSIGLAILAFNKLEQYYPKSKLTQKAIAQLGEAYGDVAFYEKASDRLEQYAKSYAGEKDAFDAMSNAVFYRKGMGEDDKALDDTKYFVKTWGTKFPDKAAGAAYSMVTIYEKRGDNDAEVKALRDYIHTWGAKGGVDKLVIAHGKIGKILWDQSCPVKTVEGACVKITRERATLSKKVVKKKGKEVYVAPQQCGTESHIKLTVVKRDDAKVREALAEFRAASQEYDKMKADTGDAGYGGARFWYAQGKFFEADVEYEKFLDIKFPPNLNYGDGLPEHKAQNEAFKKKADKALSDWLAQKKKLRDSAELKYKGVLSITDNASSIASAARLGQIAQDFSDQLFTASIPEIVRQSQIIDGYDLAQDKVDAYCDALTTAAEPLADQSLVAYGACLSESTKLGWFSDWSKLCEHELGQIKPEEFPTASELHADPNAVAPIVAPEPPARLE
jgi:tetratricopeptide (TPR) repeat protein